MENLLLDFEGGPSVFGERKHLRLCHSARWDSLLAALKAVGLLGPTDGALCRKTLTHQVLTRASFSI